MEKLQAEQEQLQEQLADTDLYSDARKDDLKAIMAKVTVNKQSLEENEMQWLELNEELEGKEQALREIEWFTVLISVSKYNLSNDAQPSKATSTLN